jgi:DNA-binding NarL/FixJ family response regulator
MTPTKLVRVEEGKRPLTLVEAIHVTRALNVGWGELIEAATLDALTTTGHSPAPNSKPVKHEILTEREQQILDLVSEDLGNAEIAQRLHLTVATVKYHVSRILLKLNVNSRVQAARWRT